jgi:hypothetical protein
MSVSFDQLVTFIVLIATNVLFVFTNITNPYKRILFWIFLSFSSSIILTLTYGDENFKISIIILFCYWSILTINWVIVDIVLILLKLKRIIMKSLIGVIIRFIRKVWNYLVSILYTPLKWVVIVFAVTAKLVSCLPEKKLPNRRMDAVIKVHTRSQSNTFHINKSRIQNRVGKLPIKIRTFYPANSNSRISS